MKQFLREYIDILNEYIDIEKTLDNYQDKISTRIKSDHSASSLSPQQVLEKIIAADPTQNKNLSIWILRTYLSQGIRYLEDLSRTNVALDLFYRNKSKLPVESRDINKIKSLSALEDLVDQFNTNKTSNELKKEEKEQIYKETEFVYRGPEGVILIPKTEESSCFWGRGTKWCTASTTSENRFKFYNKEGPLYIIVNSNGSKYQVHFETGQFMDERDKPLQDPSAIQWAVNKILNTEEKQLAAIRINGNIIKYIKNPTHEVQLAAVNTNGNAIRFIENPSIEVQVAAVHQDGYAIQYIKNPSIEVQIAAVNKNGSAIYYIKNPSLEVQLDAVKQGGSTIRFIKNPSIEVQLAAVHQDGYAIQYIKNPSIEVQIAAVNKNGSAIYHIKNPSLEVQLDAVKQGGSTIRFIKNPSIEVQLAAVKTDPFTIQYIENPSVEIQLAAIKETAYAINYIKDPPLEVQLAAIKQNRDSIRFIKNPAPEVVALAASKNK